MTRLLLAVALFVACSAEAPGDASDFRQRAVLLVERFGATSSVGTVHLADGNETLFDGDAYSPSWTPDGRIIFASRRTGSGQIWVMDAEGGHAQQIGTLSADLQPVLPQLGKNGVILFQGTDAESQPDDNQGIYTMNQDGSGLVERTRGMEPFLAPSGRWLAVVVQTDEPYHREIWRVNIDGSGLQQLTFLGDPEQPDANAPAISPDETSIAFFSGKESDRALPGAPPQPIFTWGHRNVAVIPATGGARRRLTDCQPVTTQAELDAATAASGHCIAADNPSWSPDGAWLIFDTGFVDGTETWMADPSGGNFQRFYARSRGTVRVALRFDD